MTDEQFHEAFTQYTDDVGAHGKDQRTKARVVVPSVLDPTIRGGLPQQHGPLAAIGAIGRNSDHRCGQNNLMS